jgi:hypothetical protein
LTNRIRTEPRKRIEIHAKTDGPLLTQKAKKFYRIVVALMRRHNKTSVWLHDGESSKLIAAPMVELRKILPELRDAGYLSLRQSRSGCEFTLNEGAEA